ncbi:MAG TPA: hypothetical protein VNQ55_05205, partial [Parapedobacter sp.]|nr:hypothetical protein [Parapedobacter sp.]
WIRLMVKTNDDAWKHPVYQHIDSFYRQHRQQYHRLRKAELLRYKPAPVLLPGYKRVPDFYVPYDNKDVPLETVLQWIQGIGNFRTLGVDDMEFGTEVLYGYALQYLKAEKYLTLQQVHNQRMYGDLYFADFLRDDQWQITIINRLYVFRFNWNIADNQVSLPQFWVYSGKRQPPGWLHDQFPKSHTAAQQLNNTIGTFRWSLYDEADSEVLDFNRMVTVVSDKLTTYYQAHRQEYIGPRNEELAKYPPLDTAYANTFKHVNVELQQNLLSLLKKEVGIYRLTDFMAPNETDGSYTINYLRFMLTQYTKSDAEYGLSTWVAGNGVHSMKVREEVWEIQFFYHNFAVSFRWNIATDEVSELMVKTRENVTIDRPVGVPTETN